MDRHAIYTIKFVRILQSPNILAPYSIPAYYTYKTYPCMMEASSRTSSRRIVGPGPSRSCKPFSRRNERSHLYHKDPRCKRLSVPKDLLNPTQFMIFGVGCPSGGSRVAQNEVLRARLASDDIAVLQHLLVLLCSIRASALFCGRTLAAPGITQLGCLKRGKSLAADPSQNSIMTIIRTRRCAAIMRNWLKARAAPVMESRVHLVDDGHDTS